MMPLLGAPPSQSRTIEVIGTTTNPPLAIALELTVNGTTVPPALQEGRFVPVMCPVSHVGIEANSQTVIVPAVTLDGSMYRIKLAS